MTARLRRLRASGDAGFSLAELLVTMMLIGVLMGFVLTTTTNLFKSTTDTTVRSDSLQDGQVAMDAMSKWIRTAVDVRGATGASSRYTEATPSRLTFFAATGDETTRITFFVRNGDLVQETVLPNAPSTDPNVSYDLTTATFTPGRARTERVLARGVRNPTDLFAYIPASVASPSPAPSGSPVARPSPLASVSTAAGLGDIAGIRVRLVINTSPNRGVRGAELENVVYPFNPEG